MNLRAAAAGDVAAIVALEQTLFGAEAWSRPLVEAGLAGADRSVVVAEQDGEIRGYAATVRTGEVVDLHRIGVHPAHRRTGIARSLLESAAGRARGGGAERILLEVSAANRAALAFYADAGFVEIDRRRRYYRDGNDALVLRLSLGCGADGPKG